MAWRPSVSLGAQTGPGDGCPFRTGVRNSHKPAVGDHSDHRQPTRARLPRPSCLGDVTADLLKGFVWEWNKSHFTREKSREVPRKPVCRVHWIPMHLLKVFPGVLGLVWADFGDKRFGYCHKYALKSTDQGKFPKRKRRLFTSESLIDGDLVSCLVAETLVGKVAQTNPKTPGNTFKGAWGFNQHDTLVFEAIRDFIRA